MKIVPSAAKAMSDGMSSPSATRSRLRLTPSVVSRRDATEKPLVAVPAMTTLKGAERALSKRPDGSDTTDASSSVCAPGAIAGSAALQSNPSAVAVVPQLTPVRDVRAPST